ncbi:AAA family ATPase [Chloroflexota bacterium]
MYKGHKPEEQPSLNKGKKVAITGKGGSGKTMLTALMTRILAESGNLKILAIDADSAVNLPYALGVSIGKTVAEIRRQLIEDPGAKAEVENKHIRNVMAESLESGKGFDLLVMGRPEGPGCFCGINDLLRYGIDRLSQDFDMTLIDCEAGPEQVNRRVVQGVDVLVIVTDASVRGVRVAGSIVEVVRRDEAMRHTRTGLVINRLKGDDRAITESADEWGLEIFGRIPEDEGVTEYDSVGRPIVELPDTSPSVVAVEKILEKIAR